MPSPGPRYITTDDSGFTEQSPGWTTAQNRAAAIADAQQFAIQGPFVPGPDATGYALESIRSQLREAGLIDDWAAAKSKFITLNLRVPGYIAGIPNDNRKAECFADGRANLLRAFCLAYADELIDPTRQQPNEATGWGWW